MLIQISKQFALILLLSATTISSIQAQVPDAKLTRVFKQSEAILIDDLARLLASDPKLRQKRSAIDMQRALEKSIDVLPDPELGINWSPQPMQKSLNQTFAVRAMQMMPWPGTIQANVNAQHALIEQREWLELAAQTERLASFRKVWYDGYALSKQLKWLNLHLDWIKTKDADLQTKLTTGQSQSASIELEIERIQLEQKRLDLLKKQESNYAMMNSFFTESKQWIFPDTLVYTPSTLKEFEAKHPVLFAVDSKRKSSVYKHVAAQKEGLPMIGLGAEYMLIDEALKPLAPEMQMQSAFTVMATITLPVYRSRYSSMQVEAKSSEKEAQFELDGMQSEFQAQFQTLINERYSKEHELELYGKTLPQKWNQLEQLALEKWQNGSGSFGEIIRIKRAKIELMQQYTSILTELKKIEVDLDWLQPFAESEISNKGN